MPLNIDWQQILLHLLNFLILAVGLYFILYKPVKAFMKRREESYAERERKTKDALSDAEKSREQYAEKLASAEDDIAEMKKQAFAETEAARAEKLRDAQSEAESIVAEARKKAEKEHDRMISGVSGDIRDIVTELADKVALSSDVNDAYEQFLASAEKEEKDDGKD